MQATTSKEKRRGVPVSKGPIVPATEATEAADDPDYENITLTFKHRDQPKGRDKFPKNSGPAQRGQPAPATVPHWLYRAVLSLYIILALTFLFCIILSAFILVKSSEMSQELLELKSELRNISSVVPVCRELTQGQDRLLKAIQDTKSVADLNYKALQTYSSKLNSIGSEMSSIKKDIDTIKKKLETTSPAPPASR